MIKEWMKKLAARSGEIALTLALVLVAFLAIVRLVTVFFPAGTSLGDLLAEGRRLDGAGDGAFVLNLGEDAARGSTPFVATLSRVQRTVKDKPSNAVSWSGSRTGQLLRDRHAVQTSSRSEATIRFDADEEIRLSENSLVVVRRLQHDRDSGRRQASLIVLGGELSGRVGGAGSALDLEILTAQGTSVVASGGGAGSAFSLKLNDDDTSTLSVLEGSAKVTSGGRTLTVGEDEGIVLSRSGPVGGPARIPRAPVVEAPEDRALIRHASLPPRVAFRWAGDPGTEAHRIVIASDPGFRDVAVSKVVTDPAFTHGNLAPGTWHWKVQGMRGNLAGREAPARTLRMEQDLDPPALEVGFPEKAVESATWVVKGTTEPGSRVLVARLETRAGESGLFEQAIPLQRGPNLVVVEAIDPAGNTSYRSRIINARY